MTNKLIINKGEYIFSKQDEKGLLQIKLIVFYQKRKFKWFWTKQDNINSNESELINYIEDFARRMIESKSNRNFYESN